VEVIHVHVVATARRVLPGGSVIRPVELSGAVVLDLPARGLNRVLVLCVLARETSVGLAYQVVLELRDSEVGVIKTHDARALLSRSRSALQALDEPCLTPCRRL